MIFTMLGIVWILIMAILMGRKARAQGTNQALT
jgi:hypothetical protein